MKPLTEALTHLRLVWDRRLGRLKDPGAADQLRQAFDSKPRDYPFRKSEEPLFKPGLPLLHDEEDELDESDEVTFNDQPKQGLPQVFMALTFTRDLPHSVLWIYEDTTDLAVHPHAPFERRVQFGGECFGFHLHTASAPSIRSFVEECAPHIERIRRSLREPPSDAAEEILPEAEAMAVIAERIGI